MGGPSNFGTGGGGSGGFSSFRAWADMSHPLNRPRYLPVPGLRIDLGNLEREANRVIRDFDAKLAEGYDAVARLSRSVATLERAKVMDDYKAAIRDSYAIAQNYTNLVMLGGYAAFFALWTLFKTELPPTIHAWSGVVIGLSVTMFMAWEIFKMVSDALHVRHLEEHLISDGGDRVALHAVQQTIQLKRARVAKWWPVAFAFTLVPGAFGAGILLYGIAGNLVKVL
jgi:hypothetical protein